MVMVMMMMMIFILVLMMMIDWFRQSTCAGRGCFAETSTGPKISPFDTVANNIKEYPKISYHVLSYLMLGASIRRRVPVSISGRAKKSNGIYGQCTESTIDTKQVIMMFKMMLMVFTMMIMMVTMMIMKMSMMIMRKSPTGSTGSAQSQQLTPSRSIIMIMMTILVKFMLMMFMMIILMIMKMFTTMLVIMMTDDHSQAINGCREAAKGGG